MTNNRRERSVSSQSWSTVAYLVGDSLRCLLWVVTLIDDVADLLAVHDEVNAVGGQRQEGVVNVGQLVGGTGSDETWKDSADVMELCPCAQM